MGAYTPQLVVDGAAELVGSRERDAREAIAAAARAPHARVTLARTGDALSIEVAGAPDGAEVLLAITETGLSTSVPRGENAGRTLEHGPVVRALRRVGAVRGGAFHGTESVALPEGVKREHARLVVFVQEPKGRRIRGAAALAL
jgi:hypothetical protein